MPKYLLICETADNMTVWLDKGFTCHKGGSTTIKAEDGDFWFSCSAGKHFLSGQADGDHYIGVFKSKEDLKAAKGLPR